MSTRVTAIAVAVALWGVFLWMATHVSEQPSVLSRYSSGYFALLMAVFVPAVLVTVLQFGSGYRWLHSRRKDIALFVVSVLVSLGVLEFAIRLLDPIGISYYEQAKRYHRDKVADDDLYYRMPANLQREYQGVRVETNEHGMRDGPVSAKAPGEFRIVFLGDSVTFGWGVERDRSFAYSVGIALSERLGRPARSINTGVGSYNTDNQWAVLKRYATVLQPDLVALVYVSNDIEMNPSSEFDPESEFSLDGKSPPQILKLVLGQSWFYRLVAHLSAYGKTPADGNQPGLLVDSQGWRQSVSALRNIAEFCRTSNIPLLVFSYRMAPTKLDDEISDQLKLLSTELGFHFVDTEPWFSGRDIGALINSPVDSHPNEAGHEILTEHMSEVIAQHVELPGR